MRVISGIARGHKLNSIKGLKTRPTTDRIKESLFNIIATLIPDATFLDLFAGSGAIGIEALSRGAREVIFVDQNPKCSQIIKTNLTKTKLKGEVYTRDVFSVLEFFGRHQRRFDIIFLDPPYGQNLIVPVLKSINNHQLLSKSGLVVIEYGKKEEINQSVLNLFRVRTERYSDTVLGFYRYKEELGED